MSLSAQMLVSCEHATNRLPPGFALEPEQQRRHIAWDPGALPIARHLARRFRAPLHAGRYSRLVADLNRTVGNRMMFRRVSDGHAIGFNYGLSAAARRERIEHYYRPYREALAAGVNAIIARHGRCVHLCVHTFTARLAGRVRRNDIGLLHDPSRGIERAVCADVRRYLGATGEWVVWFNRPYSGTADGILPALRRQHAGAAFVGIELEINQRHAGDAPTLQRIATGIGEALESSSALAQA